MRHFTERKIGISCIATYVVAIAALCLFVASPVTAAGENCVCGPGDHWIDACPSGTDYIDDSKALIGMDYDLDCIVDQSFIMNSCDQLIVKHDSIGGHSMDTEILQMCYESGSMKLWAGLGNAGITQPSLGVIVEDPLDEKLGHSTFNVMFAVTGTPFGTLYNHDPLQISSEVTCIPPQQRRYFKPVGCFALYDHPTSGTHVANLVTAVHLVNNPKIPTLTEWGMIIFCVLLFAWMAWMVVRRRRAPEVGI